MSRLRIPATRWFGRWLGLPPPRCEAKRSDEWVTAQDGTRLAVAVLHPVRAETRATLLIRSASAVHARRHPVTLLARLLAEQGHAVVVAGCRGLRTSEGRFDPFRADGSDGADAIDWLAKQPWFGGPLALSGIGYAGHAAWSTLASARREVAGLLVGFAARDPYAWLYSGGAFQLEAGFDFALGLAAAEAEGTRSRQLARALQHRPLIQADRVATRRIDWLRDWLEHPTRDAFWEERAVPLPRRPPRTRLLGGWHHATLPALLEDHAALVSMAGRDEGPEPRLSIGPWAATPLPRAQRDRWAGMLREIAGATRDLLEDLSGEAPRATAPVRAFVSGAGWRQLSEWPPTGEERRLHLGGSGRSPECGRLGDAPDPEGTPADSYLYDPADAAPSFGGTSLDHPGHASARTEGERGDRLRYLSEPFPGVCEITGPARVDLHAGSDATHTDFSAQLLRVGADGEVSHLSAGIARIRIDAGATTRVEIALAPFLAQLGPGDRLRLDLSSSSFPRFDRHPNVAMPVATARDEDGRVARQAIHHDEQHPSVLMLRVVG